jgi:hypothetical protein
MGVLFINKLQFARNASRLKRRSLLLVSNMRLDFEK